MPRLYGVLQNEANWGIVLCTFYEHALGESEMLRERVHPTEPRETGEVAIGRVEHAAVFDGQRGQLGITDQGTLGLAIDDHLAKKGPVIFPRGQQPDVRLIQPLVDEMHGFLRRKPLAREFWIGHDPEECGHSLPGQSHRRPVRECAFDPIAGFRMLGRSAVVSVEKDVGIENNHLCVPPSTASSSCATLS